MPKGNTGHQGAISDQYPDHTDTASPRFVKKKLRENLLFDSNLNLTLHYAHLEMFTLTDDAITIGEFYLVHTMQKEV